MPNYTPQTKDIIAAALRLQKVVRKTPLDLNLAFSEKYQANIYFKREDLQLGRSYKIRGAYNKISSLNATEREIGVVCASAGNHAQGVAYSCYVLAIEGKIFMPVTTPKQKINQVKMLGKERVEIILVGDTFDDSNEQALKYAQTHNMSFIPPFDDKKVIEGQATVGKEILEESPEIDFLFMPVGGGGLAAGVSSWFNVTSPNTQLIGVEPIGAPSMKESIKEGKVITLPEINKFIDGAAVKKVGEFCFPICQKHLKEIKLVPEGKVCESILKLYNEEAMVVEPAGALSIAVLDYYKEQIKGKNVVCIVSGGNNDITRTEEIKERSLLYQGLKHYFIVRFPQRSGALKEFVNEVLGKDDNIVFFEYSKKTNRESGPAVVGIELKRQSDFHPLMERMKQKNFFGEYINDKPDLWISLKRRWSFLISCIYFC